MNTQRPRSWRRLVSALLAGTLPAVAVLSGCGGRSGTPGAGGAAVTTGAAERIPVLVDTDLAADDILALLFLLGRPDVDVVGVTVVGDGVVRCPAGGVNARAVLATVGRTDIPVACGNNKPLQGDRAFPAAWRTQADERYGMASRWPAPAGRAGDDPVALMASMAVRHPGLHILALGPLTDVALAIDKPGFVASGAQVVVSGGAISTPGNMPTSGTRPAVAEWNIGVDPEAAARVLASGLPSRWIPLDAANLTPVDVWFAWALAAQERNRAGEAAHAFLQTNEPLTWGGSYFWDPLAAAAMVDPPTVGYRPVYLTVTTSGDEAGRTRESPTGTSAIVAMTARPQPLDALLLKAFARPGSSPSAATHGASSVTVADNGGRLAYQAPTSVPRGRTSIDLDATTGPGFALVIGRLEGGHSVADVSRLAAAGETRPPDWLVVELSADVPAGSRPTWLAGLSAGPHVVIGAQRDGTGIRVLGGLLVR